MIGLDARARCSRRRGRAPRTSAWPRCASSRRAASSVRIDLKRWSFLKSLTVKPEFAEVLELLLRRRHDVVVEALDLHLAGRGVDTSRRRACISSPIGLRAAPPVTPECWSVSPVSQTSAKPCSPRRPAGQAGRARETQIGVGDEHGVGRELLRVRLDRGLEVRRADLLLELPEQVDVQRHAGLARGADAEERA